MKAKILIIGTGAFGTALSQVLLNNHHEVYMITLNDSVVTNFKNHQHSLFPNSYLETPTGFFDNYHDAFASVNFDYLLLCVPSNALHDVYQKMKPFLKPQHVIINTAKGLNPDHESGIWSILFNQSNIKEYALFVGPSFAEEIIQKHKTIVNIVCQTEQIGKDIQGLFNNEYMKLIYYDDEYTASLCAALKNALAVALGMVSATDNSFNTQCAFLTMGLQEIQKLIQTMTKEKHSSILHYFGVGDIILTCSCEMSRNYRFGYDIVKNGTDQTIEATKSTTVEGYRTIKLIHEYIKKFGLDLPLFQGLYSVVYENYPPNKFLDLIWKLLD